MFRFFLDKSYWHWSILGTLIIFGSVWYSVQLDVQINEFFGTFYDMLQKALSAPNAVSIEEFYGQLYTFFQIAANGCLEPKPTDSAECMNGKNPLQSSLLGALIRSGRSINISPKCRRLRRSIESRENLCCKSSCVFVRIDGGSEHDLRVWKLGQVLVHTNGLGTICNAAER